MANLTYLKTSLNAMKAWLCGLNDRMMITGSFGFGTYGVAASLAAQGNWNPVETLVTSGALTGYTFALTAGGGPACAYTFAASHYNSTLQTIDGATGWTFYLLPGSATGAGVTYTEDATLKVGVAIYEAGVSTGPLVDAAITAKSSHLFVATAGAATAAIAATEGTSHALSSSPTTCATYTAGSMAAAIYFTNSSTTITQAIAAAAANPAFTAVMTLSGGTGATVLATGDAFAATALSGGVTTVAPSSIRGNGFTPTQTAPGVYKITINAPCENIHFPQVTIQLASADDKFLQAGGLTQPATGSVAGYFYVSVWDISGAGPVDVGVDANNRINFSCLVSRSTVG
jgi:hypothetical protein